ncbi:MAG: CRISPR-associated protein Cas4 [Rhizobiales bacterium]|nr:CRISPR-associated protein Cas4 [Hyphomicrobiales bacterium]
MDELDTDPIPLSALQHAIYCLRQAALIHVERLWEENRFTAEGRVLHGRVHGPGQRKLKGVRRVTGLHVASRRLGLAGVADLVEFKMAAGGETPFPVEFKRGKPKLHRADEVQLCAQGLCLEEMFGRAVPEGALFYAETKRRVVVPFDAALRALTETTAAQLRDLFASRLTPPAEYQPRKCGACSLIEQCRPKAGGRSVRAWRERMVSALLDRQDDP